MTFNTPLDAVHHMQNRQSCRNFSAQEIPQDTLTEILKTGLLAASGGNLQPYSIIVERDKVRNTELSNLCGGQPFVKNANVNLIFVLDWHKYSVYAAQKNAPYTCERSYMHFLIGVDDVMCAAQTIETAAHIMGIGSCYVGSSNHSGTDISKMYNLPQMTYPVVVLSLGYPKAPTPKAPKMPYDMMVFESRYPDFTDEQIFDGFEAKYGDKKLDLPKISEFLEARLSQFRSALLTTYDLETTDKIVQQARKDGFINETQRRFGLHYHAENQYKSGGNILDMMEKQGLRPFDILTNKK